MYDGLSIWVVVVVVVMRDRSCALLHAGALPRGCRTRPRTDEVGNRAARKERVPATAGGCVWLASCGLRGPLTAGRLGGGGRACYGCGSRRGQGRQAGRQARAGLETTAEGGAPSPCIRLDLYFYTRGAGARLVAPAPPQFSIHLISSLPFA